MKSNERLISEPIEPIADSMDTVGMAFGEPGLPRRFRWRGREHAVAGVMEKWRDTGPCTHQKRLGPQAERYVRKHWFRIVTVEGEEMKLYCLRTPRTAADRRHRWWLYSIVDAPTAPDGPRD